MFLIDTDTIIYSLKGVVQVNENFKLNASNPIAISVITYGELVFGAEKSQRKLENLAKVKRIAEIFPVINVSRGIMETFGELKSELTAKGNVIDDFDLIIGATALSMGYAVVTNHTSHFSRIPGLRVENWT